MLEDDVHGLLSGEERALIWLVEFVFDGIVMIARLVGQVLALFEPALGLR